MLHRQITISWPGSSPWPSNGRGPARTGQYAVLRLGLAEPRRPDADQEQLAEAEPIVRAAIERLRGTMEIIYVVADYYESYPKPCMYGWGARQLTVAPDGNVLPCPASTAIKTLDFDNARDKPLARIWYESSSFNAYRGEDWMSDTCRTCDRRGRLRRLPLPGVPAHRRRRGDGSGVLALAAPRRRRPHPRHAAQADELVMRGRRDEGDPARHRRGRWLPAMELRLRDCALGRSTAHPGLRRGERGRRRLVPAQRVPRHPCADPRHPGTPRRPRPREIPLRGVLLTDAELDHSLGLLLLREAGGLAVRAPDARSGRAPRAVPGAIDHRRLRRLGLATRADHPSTDSA